MARIQLVPMKLLRAAYASGPSFSCGHLHYVGGKVKKNPTLVIQSVERLIKTIHDTAHLGRDKALSQLTKRYYWPDMYKQVCEYVSRYKLGCDYIVFILVNGRYDRVISVSDRTRRI